MNRQVAESRSFLGFSPDNDLRFDDASDGRSQLQAWNGGEVVLPQGVTHFGFVLSGRAELQTDGGTFPLREGMYFAAAGPGRVQATGEPAGTGFLAALDGFEGFFHVGGPVEAKGRLRYINGCTDSLLVPPIVRGDPCLNLLHIPPAIDQTAHTHPSVRMGAVFRGRGICRTPDGETLLEPGRIFVIPKDAVHSFHTRDDSLLIVAWHPDSDFGPTHEAHPMLNRTFVDGRSLRKVQPE